MEPARHRRSAARDFTGGVRNDRREFEQAHWCLGLSGLAASDPPRCRRCRLFVQALGGGTSSRLFQELREERGLAYSVCAWSQAYRRHRHVRGRAAPPTAQRAAESMNLARSVLAGRGRER